MALVSNPFSFACLAERLARTRAGPYWPFVGPSSQSKGVGPDTNASEEVTLSEPGEFVGPDVSNVSVIDFSWRNGIRLDEFAQPRGGLRVVLIVIGRHRSLRVAEFAVVVLGNVENAIAADETTRCQAP